MRKALLLFALLCGLGCSAGAVRTQITIANQTAIAANRVLPLLVDYYRQQGLRAIATSTSRDDAVDRLASLRVAWAPVWGACPSGADGESMTSTARCVGGAWNALRVAHDAWANALLRRENGEPFSATEAAALALDLRRTYCAIRAAIPPETDLQLPDVPLLTCEGAQ